MLGHRTCISVATAGKEIGAPLTRDKHMRHLQRMIVRNAK